MMYFGFGIESYTCECIIYLLLVHYFTWH